MRVANPVAQNLRSIREDLTSFTAMEVQLFDRYLGNQGQNFGIYAVAYFTCDTWNRTGDNRKTSSVSKDDIETLKAKLRGQATKLSIGDKSVASFVIDARIGH